MTTPPSRTARLLAGLALLFSAMLAGACDSAKGPSCVAPYNRANGSTSKACARPDPASPATIDASDFAVLCANFMGTVDTEAPCSDDDVLGSCFSPVTLSDGSTMGSVEVYYYALDGVTADEAKSTCEAGGAGKWTPA
ncbi:MAG: hypothetical protein U0414_21665 [Polyangiaceae bacterium]